MNYALVIYVTGMLLRFESLFLMLPCVTALIYKEMSVALSFFGVAAVCLVLSFLLTRKKPSGSQQMYARDGFAIVALCWLVMGLFGALPFVICKDIPNYIDALFEIISGFTTTGASIVPNVEILSHGTLMWRSFSHWIGGMGVFVFILAVMPLLGGGGTNMNLMKAESPGPSVTKLVPKIKDTAKILYGIYFGITVVEVVLLCICKMPLFEALTTSFGTVGTGGFGVKADSLAGYSPQIQWIVTIFMILSGINFGIYFLLLARRFSDAFRIEEVRWYLGIVVATGLFIAWNIRDMYSSFGEAIRQSFFQVASIITTTGYATADFDLWPEISKTILVLLMFIGACASSTGGGIKVSRVILWVKSLNRELSYINHPGEVKKIRMDGKSVDEGTIRSANIYLSAYFFILLISVLLISIDNFDFTTNFTGVVACLNNIGPGLAKVGPVCNYSGYSWFSKIVLIFDMLAGRLELFPLLLVLRPTLWHRIRRR